MVGRRSAAEPLALCGARWMEYSAANGGARSARLVFGTAKLTQGNTRTTLLAATRSPPCLFPDLQAAVAEDS
jgi:hypothetical protein